MDTIPSKGFGTLIFRRARNFWAALKLEEAKSKGSFSYKPHYSTVASQLGKTIPVRTHSQEYDVPCIFRNFQTFRRSRFYRQQDILWDTKVTQLTPSNRVLPSWEANSRSASQEIPHILCYSQVLWRVPDSLPLVPILSQFNPIHNPNPTLLEDPL